MDKSEQVLALLPIHIQQLIPSTCIRQGLEELRLRVNQPLIGKVNQQEIFFQQGKQPSKEKEGSYFVTKKDIDTILEAILDYSIYAYQEEISQGFLTLQGGHRVGLAGKVVMEGSTIKTVKNISCLNIRFAHEIKGCARKLLPYIFANDRVCHTLIIAPCGCGKTTLLRDLIRICSNGGEGFKGYSVGVVDERSELAGNYLGIPQNDLGIRTDVLESCPKAQGMLMLLRSMAPEIIAVDEIGKEEDIHALQYVSSCGSKIFATVHGDSYEALKKKPVLQGLIQEKIFSRYVVLSKEKKIGSIKEIYDENGVRLC